MAVLKNFANGEEKQQQLLLKTGANKGSLRPLQPKPADSSWQWSLVGEAVIGTGNTQNSVSSAGSK
jgi:hypothetical protein